MFDEGFYNRKLSVKLQIIAGALSIREHTLNHLVSENIFNLERVSLLVEIIYLKKLRTSLIEKDKLPNHSIPNNMVKSFT